MNDRLSQLHPAMQSAIEFAARKWLTDGTVTPQELKTIGAVSIECYMDIPPTHAVVILRKGDRSYWTVLTPITDGFEVAHSASQSVVNELDRRIREGLPLFDPQERDDAES